MVQVRYTRKRDWSFKQTFAACPTNARLEFFVFAEFMPQNRRAILGKLYLVSILAAKASGISRYRAENRVRLSKVFLA